MVDAMNVARQGASFVLIGGCLVVADWMVFVLLTAFGLAAVPANVASRVAGALLGFWANGHFTFGERGAPRLGQRRFVRYGVLWVVMTALSTLLIMLIAEHLTLRVAWLAKPIVEAGLAIVSFLVSRHWVYR